MLELKALFLKDIALVKTTTIQAMIINLLNEFNANVLKDGNARDAAIDCVIAMLQDEKSTAGQTTA